MTPGWQQAAKEADLTVWLDQGTPIFFRYIAAGRLQMGTRGEFAREEPAHEVQITQPFYISIFPVTQAQWRAVAERHPDSGLEPAPSHFEGEMHPVEEVSWNDVAGWCELVVDSRALDRLQTSAGKAITIERFGLPTEAQWEYACRAGTTTDYYTGDGASALSAAGWFDGNSDGQTHPVGELAANGFGLYDMHGNVWEWCLDAYDADVYKKRVNGVADPVVPGEDVGGDDPDRVIRGGSWFFTAWFCRSAYRYWYRPDYRLWYLGFRVCLVPGPVPQP